MSNPDQREKKNDHAGSAMYDQKGRLVRRYAAGQDTKFIWKLMEFMRLPKVLSFEGSGILSTALARKLTKLREQNVDQEKCSCDGFGDASGDDGIWGKWSSDICSGPSQLQRRHARIVQRQACQGSCKGSVDINLERL